MSEISPRNTLTFPNGYLLWSLKVHSLYFCLSEAFLEGDPFPNLGVLPDFDLSPLPSSDFLGGECFGNPLDGFINLSPPQSQDYHFGLEEHEGISELFDCDFGDLTPLEF